MFHLKKITIDTHVDFTAVESMITTHPKRQFIVSPSSFNLQEQQIEKLIQSRCKVCIKSEDNFSKNKIQKFITLGKENIVLIAKNFAESDLENYLEKGASVLVSREDGFDVFQIKKLVVKGKEKTIVTGGNLLSNHIKDYLEEGGSVLLKKDNLSPFEITDLLPFGEERIHIQTGGFSNVRINKFLKGKATVIFGKGNQISQPRIEEKVKEYKSQIRIESDHFSFDLPWVKKMEDLGAVII